MPSPIGLSQLATVLKSHSLDVDESSICVHERYGRNQLFKFIALDGTRWLAKQCSQSNRSETWFYREVAPQFRNCPQPLFLSDELNLVVLPDLECHTLHSVSLDNPQEAFSHLLEVAAPLARLHNLDISGCSCPDAHSPIIDCKPISFGLWVDSTPAVQDLLRRVQGKDEVVSLVNKAISESQEQPTCLTHADLKLDNILIAAGQVVLIDWELGGVGAAAWDIASALGSMVLVWIDALAIDSNTQLEDWAALSPVSEAHMREAIRVFLKTYSSCSNQDMPDYGFLSACVVGWILNRMISEATFATSLTPRQLMRLLVLQSLAQTPDKLFRAI